MKKNTPLHLLVFCMLVLIGLRAATLRGVAAGSEVRHFLYVATPGIRDYLEYGGHGLIVFDIDHGHQFVKRIKLQGVNERGVPLNVKGVCANAMTGRIYVSTTRTLTALDIVSEKVLWEKAYEGGCDRMSMSPNGKVIYLPSLESDHWNVINAADGAMIKKITPKSGAHNTVFGIDGKHVYLAGLKAPILSIADTRSHEISETVGPFSANIRPFTVNGSQTYCYANINELLGFEVGDLHSGKMVHRVEVIGYKAGPTKRHGCPSHGIGLTPDEKELWLADAFNRAIHVFDATAMPPKQRDSIKLRDEPGWITFGIDGSFAYPSTGDVIDTRTRKIVAGLKDEEGREVQSEKLLEIDFAEGKPVRAGDQFGLGRVTTQ